MYLFSSHPNVNDLGNHALYAKGFSVKMFDSIESLAKMCLIHLNSPVVWKCGIRKADNFAFAQFAVIDFDSGDMRLSEAVQEFKDYVHILGTTKSHGLLKGNKIADRYRVFLALERKVTASTEYQSTNLFLANHYGGDVQATAAHMAFMPLTAIHSFSEGGKKISIREARPHLQYRKRSKEESNTTYSVRQFIPNYIQRWLEFGVADGERNLTCFKIGCGLAKKGFDEDEIVNIILNSSIPIDRSPRVETEIRSTVRNAMKHK